MTETRVCLLIWLSAVKWRVFPKLSNDPFIFNEPNLSYFWVEMSFRYSVTEPGGGHMPSVLCSLLLEKETNKCHWSVNRWYVLSEASQEKMDEAREKETDERILISWKYPSGTDVCTQLMLSTLPLRGWEYQVTISSGNKQKLSGKMSVAGRELLIWQSKACATKQTPLFTCRWRKCDSGDYNGVNIFNKLDKTAEWYLLVGNSKHSIVNELHKLCGMKCILMLFNYAVLYWSPCSYWLYLLTPFDSQMPNIEEIKPCECILMNSWTIQLISYCLLWYKNKTKISIKAFLNPCMLKIFNFFYFSSSTPDTKRLNWHGTRSLTKHCLSSSPLGCGDISVN